MILSRRACGLYPTTASTGTGRWCLRGRLKVNKPERYQLPITQWEAPMVREERHFFCLSHSLKVRKKLFALQNHLKFCSKKFPWTCFFGVFFIGCDIPQLASWSDFMARPSQLCQSLCFHPVLLPPGHFLLLSISPSAENSGTCEYHLTSPVLPGSNEYCIFQVALFEAGPAVGNLTLMIQPVLSSSAPRSVVLNRRNHGDRRSANRPFQSLWCSL